MVTFSLQTMGIIAFRSGYQRIEGKERGRFLKQRGKFPFKPEFSYQL